MKLLQTNWYRPGDRFDAAPIVVLHFSQPVKPEDVVAHLKASFESHPFSPPVLPQSALARLRTTDANASQAFTDKVRRVSAVASATGPVAFELAKDWDKKRFKPTLDMVVLRVTTPVPPESWVKIETDGRVASLNGLAVSNRPESYTIQVEHAFFVAGFHCEAACDPDTGNPITFTTAVKAAVFADAVRATDITTAARARHRQAAPRKRESWEEDQSETLPLADAGLEHPPATTWFASLPATLAAADGQTLGYPWGGTVENWHQFAFTSFGDGQRASGKKAAIMRGAAVLRAQLPGREAVGDGDRSVAADADAGCASQPNFETVPSTPRRRRRGGLGGTVDKTNSHGPRSRRRAGSPTAPASCGRRSRKAIHGGGAKAGHKHDGGPITHSKRDPGDQPRDQRQGQPAEHARVRHAARQRRAGVRRQRRRSFKAGRQRRVDGHDRRRRRRHGAAVAPPRSAQSGNPSAFIVTAEKGWRRRLRVGSDWNEGVDAVGATAWSFDLDEAGSLLRGTVFTDRGVYTLGEEVHVEGGAAQQHARGVQNAHRTGPASPSPSPTRATKSSTTASSR